MNGLTVRGTPRKRQYPQNRVNAGASTAERILRYVEVDEAGHWIWKAARDTGGYGQLRIGRRTYKAHRVSYEAFVGPIPDGLHIDHLCRIRECVNPQHLEPVTCLENVRRSPISHGCESACPRGHLYDEENTLYTQGRRYCRTCQSVYSAIYRAMTPEERQARKDAGLPVVDLAAYFAEQESAA